MVSLARNRARFPAHLSSNPARGSKLTKATLLEFAKPAHDFQEAEALKGYWLAWQRGFKKEVFEVLKRSIVSEHYVMRTPAFCLDPQPTRTWEKSGFRSGHGGFAFRGAVHNQRE